jgi:hypothetical protein
MNCGCGLSLERWRDILGYDPFHFWQLSNSGINPVRSNCNTLMREYAWQQVQQLGRADIRQAIATAEQRLTEHLHYAPYPRYFEEVIPLHRSMWHIDCYGGGWGCGSKCVNVRLGVGKIQAFGIRAFETVASNLTLTVSDQDGDTLYDTFTVSIDDADSLEDYDNTYLYPTSANLPLADRNPAVNGYECKYLVKPFDYSVDESIPPPILTLYGRAWQIVKPTLYQGVGGNNSAAKDPNQTATYSSALNVLRHYTNGDGVTTDTAAVIFEYDNPCTCGYGCCAGDLPYQRLGQGVMKDAGTGEVTLYLATFDPETEAWSPSSLCECRFPDRVRVRYYAGDDNPCKWDEVIARLAIAELTRRPCGCDNVADEFTRWYTDRAITDPNKSFAFKEDDLSNPFGTREGALYAWRRVVQQILVRGIRA